MSISRFAAAALGLAAVVANPAAAVPVDCPDIPATGVFSDGLCRSVPAALDASSLPRDATEVTSNDLEILAADGNTEANLNFEFISDDGAFKFCFGFCRESDVDADLLTRIRAATEDAPASEEDRFAFAEACVALNGNKVFEDLGEQTTPGVPPGVFAEIEDVALPVKPVFFILPDNLAADFTGENLPELDTDEKKAAYRRTFWFENNEKPLFSLSGANPGAKDQLVLFTANDRTMFAWEDITRTRPVGGSYGTLFSADNDFGDLVFTVDTELVGAPESDCPAGCDSKVVSYTSGITTSHSSDGNCACIDFTCE